LYPPDSRRADTKTGAGKEGRPYRTDSIKQNWRLDRRFPPTALALSSIFRQSVYLLGKDSTATIFLCIIQVSNNNYILVFDLKRIFGEMARQFCAARLSTPQKY
jgi:hypothetical protein